MVKCIKPKWSQGCCPVDWDEHKVTRRVNNVQVDVEDEVCVSVYLVLPSHPRHHGNQNAVPAIVLYH